MGNLFGKAPEKEAFTSPPTSPSRKPEAGDVPTPTASTTAESAGLATAVGSAPHASSPSRPVAIGGPLASEDAAADAALPLHAYTTHGSPASTAHLLDETNGKGSSVMDDPNGSDIDCQRARPGAHFLIYPAPTPAPGSDPMPTVTFTGADVSHGVDSFPLPDDNETMDDPSTITTRYANIEATLMNGSGHSGPRHPNDSSPSARSDSMRPHSLTRLGHDKNTTMIDPDGSSQNGVYLFNGGSMIAAPVHATEQLPTIMDPTTRLVPSPLPNTAAMAPSFPALGTTFHGERSIAAGRSTRGEDGASPDDSAASDGESDDTAGVAAAIAPRIFVGTGGTLPLPMLPAHPVHSALLLPPPLISTGLGGRPIRENDDGMHRAKDGSHWSGQASEEGGASPTSSAASDGGSDDSAGVPAATASPSFRGTGGALPLPMLPMLPAHAALLVPPPLGSVGPRSRIIRENDDGMQPAEDGGSSSDQASEEGGESNEAMDIELKWRDESFEGRTHTEVLHMQDPHIIQARSMSFAKNTCDQLYHVLHAGRTEEERRKRNRQTPRRYVVTAELGAGAHGTVYKAVRVVRQEEHWDAESNTGVSELTVTGPPVALKRINKGPWVPNRHMTMTHRIRTEIEICRNLDHPHIIKLLDTFTTTARDVDQPPDVWLVFEHMPHSVESVMKTLKPSPEMERRWVLELTDAIAYMHDRGYFHRDIKLDNMLLDDNFHVKLTDFGCAHGPAKTDKEKELHAHLGALSHRPPELHMKLPFDGKVDSWSIGLFAFALKMDKLPFRHRTPSSAVDCAAGLLGLPDDGDWEEGVSKAEELVGRVRGDWPRRSSRPLAKRLNPFLEDKDGAVQDWLKFLECSLAFAPLNRLSPRQLLDLPYLQDHINEDEATLAGREDKLDDGPDNLEPLVGYKRDATGNRIGPLLRWVRANGDEQPPQPVPPPQLPPPQLLQGPGSRKRRAADSLRRLAAEATAFLGAPVVVTGPNSIGWRVENDASMTRQARQAPIPDAVAPEPRRRRRPNPQSASSSIGARVSTRTAQRQRNLQRAEARRAAARTIAARAMAANSSNTSASNSGGRGTAAASRKRGRGAAAASDGGEDEEGEGRAKRARKSQSSGAAAPGQKRTRDDDNHGGKGKKQCTR